MSSESLKCIGPPNGDEYLIRTTWQSEEDWKKWLNNDERGAIQQQIDSITGEKFGSGDNKFNLCRIEARSFGRFALLFLCLFKKESGKTAR